MNEGNLLDSNDAQKALGRCLGFYPSFHFQTTALQEAYDDLQSKRGAIPFFLMKYTESAVQLAPLQDWETFLQDSKKVP